MKNVIHPSPHVPHTSSFVLRPSSFVALFASIKPHNEIIDQHGLLPGVPDI